jgi:hypothetical protein
MQAQGIAQPASQPISQGESQAGVQVCCLQHGSHFVGQQLPQGKAITGNSARISVKTISLRIDRLLFLVTRVLFDNKLLNVKRNILTLYFTALMDYLHYLSALRRTVNPSFTSRML